MPPDAFLSYTRFDDRYHGGAISAFRDQLSMAVRAVTATPFEIFQDVDGIELGENWRERLNIALGETRFFIPILTPNYFESKACRDELERFLEFENQSGRNDLVLPIYYIDCDVIEDSQLRASDPLATQLHERQRHDWRKLRHNSFKTKVVRTELELLARRVAGARRRVVRAASATPSAETSPTAVAVAQPEAAFPTDSPLAPTPGDSPAMRQVLPANPGTVLRDADAPWCPELVDIPPGEFMMGSTETERAWAIEHGAEREWVESEKPQHLVKIGYPLAIGRYPLTFDEYDHFARATRREQPGDEGWGRGRRPVINVSWDDAKTYVEWLASETGQPYRLLSEAEWEYACRAGTTTRYWWGDDTPTLKQANFGRNEGRSTEVGAYPANPWGLYDMHGNVWEWVDDCWNDSYEGAPDAGRAWTSGDCSRRVLRGGSWNIVPMFLRSADRYGFYSDARLNFVGFRVARTLSRSESGTP